MPIGIDELKYIQLTIISNSSKYMYTLILKLGFYCFEKLVFTKHRLSLNINKLYFLSKENVEQVFLLNFLKFTKK